MKVLFDTCIWIEFLTGSTIGATADELLSKHDCYTTESTLSEVVSWCLRHGVKWVNVIDAIVSRSRILKVNYRNWIEAAEIRHIRRKTAPTFGIMDAILVAKQRELGSTLVTSDSHFIGMEGVEFVK